MSVIIFFPNSHAAPPAKTQWQVLKSVFANKKPRKGILGIAYHYITCPYVHTNMYCMYIQYVWYVYAAAHVGNGNSTLAIMS